MSQLYILFWEIFEEAWKHDVCPGKKSNMLEHGLDETENADAIMDQLFAEWMGWAD